MNKPVYLRSSAHYSSTPFEPSQKRFDRICDRMKSTNLAPFGDEAISETDIHALVVLRATPEQPEILIHQRICHEQQMVFQRVVADLEGHSKLIKPHLPNEVSSIFCLLEYKDYLLSFQADGGFSISRGDDTEYQWAGPQERRMLTMIYTKSEPSIVRGYLYLKPQLYGSLRRFDLKKILSLPKAERSEQYIPDIVNDKVVDFTHTKQGIVLLADDGVLSTSRGSLALDVDQSRTPKRHFLEVKAFGNYIVVQRLLRFPANNRGGYILVCSKKLKILSISEEKFLKVGFFKFFSAFQRLGLWFYLTTRVSSVYLYSVWKSKLIAVHKWDSEFARIEAHGWLRPGKLLVVGGEYGLNTLNLN